MGYHSKKSVWLGPAHSITGDTNKNGTFSRTNECMHFQYFFEIMLDNYPSSNLYMQNFCMMILGRVIDIFLKL